MEGGGWWVGARGEGPATPPRRPRPRRLQAPTAPPAPTPPIAPVQVQGHHRAPPLTDLGQAAHRRRGQPRRRTRVIQCGRGRLLRRRPGQQGVRHRCEHFARLFLDGVVPDLRDSLPLVLPHVGQLALQVGKLRVFGSLKRVVWAVRVRHSETVRFLAQPAGAAQPVAPTGHPKACRTPGRQCAGWPCCAASTLPACASLGSPGGGNPCGRRSTPTPAAAGAGGKAWAAVRSVEHNPPARRPTPPHTTHPHPDLIGLLVVLLEGPHKGAGVVAQERIKLGVVHRVPLGGGGQGGGGGAGGGTRGAAVLLKMG